MDNFRNEFGFPVVPEKKPRRSPHKTSLGGVHNGAADSYFGDDYYTLPRMLAGFNAATGLFERVVKPTVQRTIGAFTALIK